MTHPVVDPHLAAAIFLEVFDSDVVCVFEMILIVAFHFCNFSIELLNRVESV